MIKKKIFMGLLALVLIAGTVLLFLWLRPKPLITPAVRKQISFVIFVPSQPYYLDKKSISYDQKNRLLTFVVKSHQATARYTMTEQAEPDNFVDIPQLYTAIVNRMNNYATIDTSIGRVDLTVPSKLNGGQTAVATSQGTLIFAKPSSNQSEDAWRSLFNSFSSLHQ